MTAVIPGPDLLSDRARSASSSVIRELLRHAKRPDVISMAGGIPAPEMFPSGAIAESAARVLSTTSEHALQYGLTRGVPELREQLAAMTGADCGESIDADGVVVTTGSQQGLDLLARTLVDPGDTVVVEDPGYLGALQALRSYGPKLEAIPLDRDGMRTDLLQARLEHGLRPVFCYVIPNFQNPTGVTMNAERRRHLLELAEKYGFLIADDDPYGELRFEGEPVEMMGQGTGNDSGHPSIVRLRTVSKTVAPGLRIGWLTGPEWLLEAIEISKQSVDLHTSTFVQHVLHGLFVDPAWLQSHLDRLRPWYRDRRDALCDSLAETFGDRVRFDRPSGGMFVWAEFPGIGDTARVLPRALDHGVAFVPGGAFAVAEPRPETMRLSFATVSPEQIADAVRRLAKAIDAPPE